MKKATTTSAAAKTLKMTVAKIGKISEIETISTKKSCGIFLAITVGSTDPDPMDWTQLDSLMSKPPTKERKPRKPAYKKPEAVKKLEAVTGQKHRDNTANGLTKCIIDYIVYNGGQAERINTMGVPIDRRRQVTDVLGRTRTIGSVEWRRGGGTVGSADISAVINSKAVKIEVKIGKDRQSAAQRQYQAAVEQAGGLYYIARNFTDFVAWYNQNFGKGGRK